jgi:hypothetical protein
MRHLIWFSCLSGCFSWSPGTVSQVQTKPPPKAVVVHGGEAVELEEVSVSEHTLAGRRVSAWRINEGQALSEGDHPQDDPARLAKQMGWQAKSVPAGEFVEIPVETISSVRVAKRERGADLGFGFGGAGAVFTIIILGLCLGAPVPCGRPLRVRGRRVVTPVKREHSDWNEPATLMPVPDEVRRMLAEIWTEEAQAEHAAVAAFSKLALELIAMGAPPRLLHRANRAAMQEVRHARLCFALASAYRGEPVSPGPLPSALSGDHTSLAKLARESIIDGCLREGLAAEIARLGAEHARDPEVARVLRIQARDELGHARLAWEIVEWCLAEGDESVRCAALQAVDEAGMPRVDDLPEHGRVGRDRIAPIFEAMRDQARQRLGSGCARAAA